jgi:hypothetical protein
MLAFYGFAGGKLHTLFYAAERHTKRLQAKSVLLSSCQGSAFTGSMQNIIAVGNKNYCIR